MSRTLLILALIISSIIFNCYSQSLLSVNWQKVVCTDDYIDYVYSICNDNNGNTYTLGSFPIKAICLGENVEESSGRYFLTKQNLNGDKVFVKNFGGTKNFTFGDIQVCRNGDIVLGLSFMSTFFLNGDSIAFSADWSSIILKLDQDFNLKWFKTFPSTHNTYINHILLDINENVYTSILFFETLSINGKVYSQQKGYATAIAKLSPEGDILWSHHYYSNNILYNQVLKIGKSCSSCTNTVFIAGKVEGNAIFIDGVSQVENKNKYDRQYSFVATLNDDGDILQTKFLAAEIYSLIDINFYQNRIFFAGTYACAGNNSSIYIAELNEKADLIGFANLQSNKKTYLTGFKISSQYGFLISGNFSDVFILQSTSITLKGQYIGSFIISVNDSFKLNDCKYIEGGSFNLRYFSIFNNKITGAAMFEGTCNFKNYTCFAHNEDILTFQTTDIKQLNAFDPPTLPVVEVPCPNLTVPLSVQIYPNPFTSSFKMKFSQSVLSTSLIMTNALGQVCKESIFTQINDTEITIDASELSAGLYIIQYLTSNNFRGTYRILKINE